MIHQQTTLPRVAKIGDVWTDGKTFKRVLSRGSAWENVNLGSKHPDEVLPLKHGQQEVDDEQQQATGAEAGRQRAEVPSGAGESAPGNGDDGQALSESSVGAGPQDAGLIQGNTPLGPETAGDPNPDYRPDAAREPGIDANGSPVL
jgi:hypothetical protein